MRKKPTVLVVDDLSLNRLMVIVALEQMGCEAVEACDGAEALQALRREPFDLVVMDCQMPVMDGPAATQQIRADQCQTPILAYTTDENREQCLAAGMSDFLCKPAPLLELKGRLAYWLDQQAA